MQCKSVPDAVLRASVDKRQAGQGIQRHQLLVAQFAGYLYISTHVRTQALMRPEFNRTTSHELGLISSVSLVLLRYIKFKTQVTHALSCPPTGLMDSHRHAIHFYTSSWP